MHQIRGRQYIYLHRRCIPHKPHNHLVGEWIQMYIYENFYQQDFFISLIKKFFLSKIHIELISKYDSIFNASKVKILALCLQLILFFKTLYRQGTFLFVQSKSTTSEGRKKHLYILMINLYISFVKGTRKDDVRRMPMATWQMNPTLYITIK